MRPEFLEPQGELNAYSVRDVLLLVLPGSTVPAISSIERWSDMERLAVYDWAMREHLHASDGSVRRRQRPRLLYLSRITDG
jgi:hypothetical protein